MNKPKISVIMSVYNGMPHLKDAVWSILNQSFKNLEFIVVEDGSNDDSWRFLKSLKDKRIKLIKNKANIGLAKSLNKGIAIARGQFIARMDSDDISSPGRFEEQIKFFGKNPDIMLCGSWATLIDEKGRIIGQRKYPTTDSSIRSTLPFINPLIHPSITFRKQFFEEVGLYDSKYEMAEDYELWLRARGKLKMANLPKLLIKLRSSSAQRSRNQLKQMEQSELKARLKHMTDILSVIGLVKKLITYLIPIQLKIKFGQILNLS